MKTLFSAILASVLLTVCSLAQAQDTPSRDTIHVNFLEGLSKGDVLPFKYIYQRAKVMEDTTIMCSISKDISLEVLENDKENHWVLISVVQENYVKAGPEANKPQYSGSTFLLKDGHPLEIAVSYSGDMAMVDRPDTLVSRAARNLDYVSDTLANSVLNKAGLSKEQWKELFSEMQDTSTVMWNAVSDIYDLFFFGAYDYEADTAYTNIDSIFCETTKQTYYYGRRFGWDKTFSDNNESYSDMYVFRSFYRIDGIPFLERLYDPIPLTEEVAEELLKKADPKRCIHIMELSELADKGAGIPILLEKTCLDGYYAEVGDDYMKITKEVLALDIEKLLAQEGDDDDEEDEDDQPRYDDYGFIKVK